MLIEITVNGATVTIPNADATLIANIKTAINSWERRTYDGVTDNSTMVKTMNSAMLMQNAIINRGIGDTKVLAIGPNESEYIKRIERQKRRSRSFSGTGK